MNRFSIFAILAFVAIGFSTFAQSKARIYIRKDNNGIVEEEVREVEVADGQSIETILKEMGVLDEFGQLKHGQQFQINIEKSAVPGENPQQYTLRFDPNLAWVTPAPIETETHAFLGVMLRSLEASEIQNEKYNYGTVITEIIPGTAAETSGLQMNDCIIEIDGEKIENMESLIQMIRSKTPGDKIKVTFLREGKKKSESIVLGESEPAIITGGIPGTLGDPEFLRQFDFHFNPDSITIVCPDELKTQCDSFRICQPFSWDSEGFMIDETPFLGVTPAQEESAEGVLLGSIIEGSSAEQMGIVAGDIITSINSNPLNNFNQLAELISTLEPGTPLTIELIREGKNKTVEGTLGKRSASNRDGMRIFHDYKGMDENGNYFYDYEFDMDAEDIEQQMEELLQMLDEQQMRLDEERERLESELDRIRDNNESISIRIEIDEITNTEAVELRSKNNSFNASENTLNFQRISFFPNPNNGIINLTFSSDSTSPIDIDIFDAQGKKIYMERISNFNGEYMNTIDISAQPNGNYYLQIRQDDKSYSKKIVKS